MRYPRSPKGDKSNKAKPQNIAPVIAEMYPIRLNNPNTAPIFSAGTSFITNARETTQVAPKAVPTSAPISQYKGILLANAPARKQIDQRKNVANRQRLCPKKSLKKPENILPAIAKTVENASRFIIWDSLNPKTLVAYTDIKRITAFTAHKPKKVAFNKSDRPGNLRTSEKVALISLNIPNIFSFFKKETKFILSLVCLSLIKSMQGKEKMKNKMPVGRKVA